MLPAKTIISAQDMTNFYECSRDACRDARLECACISAAFW